MIGVLHTARFLEQLRRSGRLVLVFLIFIVRRDLQEVIVDESEGRFRFCLHFTTNENSADRQISLFGEGLARTNPSTT